MIEKIEQSVVLMEKSRTTASSSIESSRDLQCVGKMEIVKPKPVGFLCGSIPVPTDNSFHAFNSALVPLLAQHIIWEDGAVASNLSRKCEALAVSGLVEYGDEIDVIAPTDILKQIFKIPYSKARLSIAVHRVGQTLILNTGPDVEEGEKLVRRHNNQSKCTDQSLFLNFAMHSVRMEACDCPPSHQAPLERQSDSAALPRGETPNFVAENDNISRKDGIKHHSDYSQVKQDELFWGSKKAHRNKSRDSVKKASHVGEKPRCSVQDNEKYAAVSLHLWDVTPLNWLEAWLDNVMASVPEWPFVIIKTVLCRAKWTYCFEVSSRELQARSWCLLAVFGDVMIVKLLPSLVHRGRSDSLFSLGTSLRIAPAFTSMATNNRAKCANFFKKCLDFLDEPDHLVWILIFKVFLNRLSAVYDISLIADNKITEDEIDFQDLASEVSAKMNLEANISASNELTQLSTELGNEEITMTSLDLASEVSAKMNLEANISASNELTQLSNTELGNEEITMTRPITDPVSSKLAAVHHVSQAIKSLRWMRQLQTSQPELDHQDIGLNGQPPSSMNFSVCACGDADCIEVCDIREWLPTSKLDHKLWKLLLLGESYLALGQAYKEDVKCSQSGTNFNDSNEKKNSFICNVKEVKSNSAENCYVLEQFSSTYLFWANAWTLVGDVYVELHVIKGKEISAQSQKKPSNKMQFMFLVNCSCQSDRVSSGNSASSSGGDTHAVTYSRKHGKRSRGKNVPHSLSRENEDNTGHQKVKNKQVPDSGLFQHNGDSDNKVRVSNTCANEPGVNSVETTNSERAQALFRMHEKKSEVTVENEIASKKAHNLKDGGIFKYLMNTVVADAEHNLSSALSCYEEAIKALGELPSGLADLQSLLKKKGWACNELGRNRLVLKELNKAELAFTDAINAFKEASDYTNVVYIYCNLGHGRRALAEEMVTKMEGLKTHKVLHIAYKQALETAKLEYSESLRFYGAAKSEMNAIVEEAYSDSDSNLKREDITAEVYENGALEEPSLPHQRSARKELRKYEITANEAIREALSLYESLGGLHHKKSGLLKGENGTHHRAKQYASMAERNWLKAIDFYGPQTS
ncbi:Detected protein of unknown function [Hibiscus syriacus]|uniref:EDRF1 N-terminal domain-containing protein n=1 Tax=Hibiscus syriacus TaxID=106335 RepID=A0A6A3ACT8_HIBSY|nr:Detected protein of unknown function [Hibiscus syriacus]